VPLGQKQIPATTEPGTLSSAQSIDSDFGSHFPPVEQEEEELMEQDIRDKFKRMCEGYFDSVSKKLVFEHKVGSWLVSRAE
jgi:regulator of nonsense transcripts 2